MHLLVSELYIYQNARCNNEKNFKILIILNTEVKRPYTWNKYSFVEKLVYLHKIYYIPFVRNFCIIIQHKTVCCTLYLLHDIRMFVLRISITATILGDDQKDLPSVMVSRGPCEVLGCLSPVCHWGKTVSIPGYFMWD